MAPPSRLLSRTGLIAAWILLVVVPLPVREVMPPDEPRFAHQAQSMKTSGDWIVPRIGDSNNVDKPPVLFWSVCLASLPLDRVTATTARIPSALGALAVLLLTARLGRRLFRDDAVAYGGALIALTGIEFFQKAEWCSCDMTMAAFAFAAITLWGEALFGEPPPARPGFAIALGWTAVGLGVLTKGPVALLWALFFVVAEAIARRRGRSLLRLLANPGLLIMPAIVGGWLVALGMRAGWGYVYEATIYQNLNRYAHAWNSVQPWWFFGYQTPADLLPWSAFLPAAIAVAAQKRSAFDDEGDATAVRTLALFALFGIVFFSTSSGKRGVYVMESFPAISLLIAAAVVRARRGGLGFVLMTILGVIAGVVAPIALAAHKIRIPPVVAASGGPGSVAALAVAGVALAVGAGRGLSLLRVGRGDAALASVVSGALVTMLLAGTVGGVVWTRVQGARPFCAKMDAILPAGERIAVEGSKFEQFMFYTLRKTCEFNDDAELVKVLAGGSCRYAIVVRSRYDRMKDAPPLAGLPVLAEAPISEKSYVLVGPR
jgi:4-amino-4-deoxy-L-arabinose transferase-like glycosyltransferase